MRVRLNLATKPLETHRRFLAVSAIIGGIAGVVFLTLGWHVYSMRSADANYRRESALTVQKIAELETERQSLELFFARPENAKLSERAAFLNSIIDSSSLNWTQMFMDLEKVLPVDVRVISIEPKQAGGRVEVKLKVGALNNQAKLKFLEALEHSTYFSQVKLNSEQGHEQNSTADQQLVELTVVYTRG